MTKESLANELTKRDIPFTESSLNELVKYMGYILSWNEKVNLTAIKDESAFLEKMIFDSALSLTDLDLTNKKVIDVGTGAGFPGMVLYLLNKNIDLSLLDSTAKKIKIIEDYAKENKLNIECVSDRVENYVKRNREKFDYAFARAVAPLNILIELCVPLLKVGGYFLALKGPGFEEEINDSEKALAKLNCSIVKIISDSLPESGEARNIIYIQKNKATNNKYPRDYSEIKKLPL